MLRILLPPNLAAAASRDAVAVRVDLDLSAAPGSALLPALALLQRWLGPAAPAPRVFLQLNRAQLRELTAALAGQPLFAWAQAPERAIPWQGGQLVGVAELLAAPPAPPADQAAPAAAPRPRPAADPMTIDGSEHFLAVTLPSREHPSYPAVLELLKGHGFLPEPSNGKWWLRDRHKTLSFLAAEGRRLRGEFGARFTPNFERNTARVRPAEILCAAAAAGDAFEVTLGLRAGAASEAELRGALLAGRGYVEAAGEIILFDGEQLRRLGEAQRALAGDPQGAVAARQSRRVSAAQVAATEELLAELAPGFEPPATWRARSAALRNLAGLAPAPLPPELDSRLRPYQRLGVAWLWHLYGHRLGGILADEMGLGKTLQALSLLAAIRRAGPMSALVVCPASLLENWRREAARFAPDLRVFVHHGDQRLAGAAALGALDLIVTSYGTLVRDEALFQGLEFTCAIADEAQHLKNRRSQNARALRGLRAQGRFLLTGTPVENSLADLRSLFDFILPGYLDPVPAGARGEERGWLDQRLRAQTAPYILRRTKQAVAPELPPKFEQVLWCELAPAQAALYRRQQEQGERELFDLEAGGASESRLRLAALTQLLRLRQICCDPRLVEAGRALPAPAGEPFAESGKLEAFRELLAEAVDDGHRILVFSQFTSLLALLRAELGQLEVPCCYLDGAMPTAARQAAVDQFQASADIPVFLLSLKAGGSGLNLTGADTVVHFDPWWNPAAQLQATDRAHRIGQTRAVSSYQLIAGGTVEERVLGLQAEKRALLADVFEASDAAAAQLSLGELKSLLSR
jgi:superfamily II DNA or RNA helicase